MTSRVATPTGLKLERILAVADPRDAVQHALVRAHALAQRAGAGLTAVAFVHEDLPNLPLDLGAASLGRMRARILAHYRRWLEAERRRLPQGGRDVQLQVVWQKRVAAAVIRMAAGFDLVVKTGHRTESWHHTPTDWQLIRGCPAPLWIVATPRWRPGRGVLAAVDLGTRVRGKRLLNDAIVEAGAAMAGLLGGRLHIAYAPPFSAVLRDLGFVDARSLGAGGAVLAERYAAQRASEGATAAPVHVKAGPPEKVLASLAARHRCALVVVGSIGRSGLAGAVVGNTAERILGMLRTDVLVLKPARGGGGR